MNPVQAPASSVFALLADGTAVEIRQAAPADFDAVKSMHEAMSRDNSYLRFFSFSRQEAGTEAHRVCRDPGPGHAALLALLDGEVIGVASYEAAGRSAEPDETAEIAFAVADRMHRRGAATLLLEHLVSLARSREIANFTATVLAENAAMLKVFADAGLPVRRHFADGVMELTFPLPRADAAQALDVYLETVAARERGADVASLRHVFAPESIAVIGAGQRPGTVGRAILDNIRTGGFAGRVYAVNPRVRQIGGERCVPSVLELPEPVDLAVIAVPLASVLDLVDQCGRRGVRAVAVITSGLDTPASANVLATCRRHGMRLVGPGCFGIAVPRIGLDASFAASHPRPGIAGLVMQSGGLGFALLDQLSRLGIGISSFASVGSKLDVSSNDLLMWWEQDGDTRLAVLYIESFGNPRKFARTARRVGQTMPVLTVYAGRPESAVPGTPVPGTTTAACPLVSRQALFEQAGIIATSGLGELIEVTALLAAQPVPAGGTVAIVSNVGAAAALAADAATEMGLTVHQPRGLARRRLRALIPDGGTVTGPVDTTTAVSGEAFRQCLELLAADDGVDAMIALVEPTAATGDLVAAIQDAEVGIPLAAVLLDQPESVRLLPRPAPGAEGPGAATDGARPDAASQVPAYAYPEAAAHAIARAARYGMWRAEPHGQVPVFPDISAGEARMLVRGFVGRARGGGWLSPADTAELLRCYGIPLAAPAPAAGEVTAAGAVTAAGTVTATSAVTAAGAARLDAGTEVIIEVADDQIFGPLVFLGLGGAATEALADRAARLAPLTDADADKLIRSIRPAPRPAPAPLSRGHRAAADPAAAAAAVDADTYTAALRDLLLRVSRLAEDLPEVTDLELSPVIARPDGAVAVAARVKVAPHPPRDPFLRRLR